MSMSCSGGRSRAKDTGRLLVKASPCWPNVVCNILAMSLVVARNFSAASKITVGNTAGSMIVHKPLAPSCDATVSLVTLSSVIS